VSAVGEMELRKGGGVCRSVAPAVVEVKEIKIGRGVESRECWGFLGRRPVDGWRKMAMDGMEL
jgi:hypothetical protein